MRLCRRSGSRLKSVEVKLPGVVGTWELDGDQRNAAWELYVELVTRTALQPLDADDGVLREALSSLHAIFRETREILRRYGPGIAVPPGEGQLSFGALAVDLLNQVLRPVLAKWHPLLLAHEHDVSRPAGILSVEWERRWPHAAALRRELLDLQAKMRPHADLLCEAAGVPCLHGVAGDSPDPHS